MRIRRCSGLVPHLPEFAEIGAQARRRRPAGRDAGPGGAVWTRIEGPRLRVSGIPMRKHEDRLRRQFEAIERKAPVGGSTLRSLRQRHYRFVRIPLGVLLVLGGLFGFLPVLGLWMLPLGLLLLAVDIPRLRGCVSAWSIRFRRRLDIWGRRLRHWRSG